MKVGIDFGTINSSLIFLDDKLARTLLVDEDRKDVNYAPTLLFIYGKDKNVECGWDISRNHRDGIAKKDSVLIKDLKEQLGDDTVLYIEGFDKWELFKIYITYLIDLANRSNYIKGLGYIDEVIMSKPVDFSTLYSSKIREVIGTIKVKDDLIKNIIVSGVVDEPLSICMNRKSEFNLNNNILTVDIGGGTTDIAIVKIGDYSQVIANEGYKHFAGNYIDLRLSERICELNNLSYDTYFGKDNINTVRNHNELRYEKEKIDRKPNKTMALEFIDKDNIPTSINVEYEDYKEIIKPFYDRIIELSYTLINKQIIDGKIDKIILAGGVSNCRYLHELFNSKFKRIEILSDEMDCTIATASGNAKYNTLDIGTILNHSYGISLFDEKRNITYINNLFFKGESLPITNRKLFLITRFENDQSALNFYEGYEKNTSNIVELDFDNQTFLSGKTVFYQFGKLMPKGTAFNVVMSMDKNGILSIKLSGDQLDTKDIEIGLLL